MKLVLSEEQEEQLQCMCLEKECTGSSKMQAVWLTWEAFLGMEQVPRAGGAPQQLTLFWNWVQPVQEQFQGVLSYEDET